MHVVFGYANVYFGIVLPTIPFCAVEDDGDHRRVGQKSDARPQYSTVAIAIGRCLANHGKYNAAKIPTGAFWGPNGAKAVPPFSNHVVRLRATMTNTSSPLDLNGGSKTPPYYDDHCSPPAVKAKSVRVLGRSAATQIPQLCGRLLPPPNLTLDWQQYRGCYLKIQQLQHSHILCKQYQWESYFAIPMNTLACNFLLQCVVLRFVDFFLQPLNFPFTIVFAAHELIHGGLNI